MKEIRCIKWRWKYELYGNSNCKKLDISRSYLYYLKENGLIEIELNEKGRPMWTEEVYDRLKEYIKKIM